MWCYEAHNTDERQLLERLNANNPIIVTDLHHRIIGVNREWVHMCRYSAEDAFGNTPALLQGALTERDVARDFVSQICAGHTTFASLVNYKKDGTPFVNHLYGWCVGDLLVAETYAEHALDGDSEVIRRILS